MEALTNETYFTILDNCTIEAFESLELKELYPKNGIKAIWDVSTLTITKGNNLPTKKDNELYRKQYIKENMRVTFLLALDRFCKDFEIKHSITRDFFYKKCYQSILFKISNSPLWHGADFGFNIDKEPCKLTFIWNMITDIEARSVTPKATIKQPEPEPLDLSVIPIIKFQNNFDRVSESIIFEYFKTKLVDKKYITESILNDYLKLAFDKKTPPKQKFSFEKLNTQNDIIQIFYNYYKTTSGKPYGEQIKYFNLLKNYFNGFEKLNIKNFSK